MPDRLTLRKEKRRGMADLAAIRARLAEIQNYLDSIETCHVCGGTLVLEESAPHCENCSWDCDEHDEPSCEAPFYKHDKAKRAVAALLAALDAKSQKEGDRETPSR